ncbi:MAG: hypothetical protein KH135_00300 [Firmicutes bacterium]|nr:hypothetical protein [Bacillota bacterium]
MRYEKKYVVTRLGDEMIKYFESLEYYSYENMDGYERNYFMDGDILIELDIYQNESELILLTAKSNENNLEEFVPKQQRGSLKKGLVEVTNCPRYQSPETIFENIKPFKVVVEGPKGSGKSTVIRFLVKKGVNCRDRDQEVFSNDKIIGFNLDTRADFWKERIHRNPNEYFLLLTCSKEVLEERLSRRTIEGSGYTYEHEVYQNAYEETYDYLKREHELHHKLYKMNNSNLPIRVQKRFAMETIEKMEEHYHRQKTHQKRIQK